MYTDPNPYPDSDKTARHKTIPRFNDEFCRTIRSERRQKNEDGTRTDWSCVQHYTTCNEKLTCFNAILSKAIDSHLPMRSIKLHPSDKPWINTNIKKLIAKRQRAWLTGHPSAYSFYRNKATKLCRQSRRTYFNSKILNTKDSNPKKWWKNIKALSGFAKPPLPSCLYHDGEFKRGADLADLIAESFSKVSDDIPALSFTKLPITTIPNEFILSPQQVEYELSNIKVHKSVGVSFLQSEPEFDHLTINGSPLEVVDSFKLLGITLSSDLSWNIHVSNISAKASKRLYALRILKRHGVPVKNLISIFCSFIRPVLEYACQVWHSSLPLMLSDQIEHIQKRALKIVFPHHSYAEALDKAKLKTLQERREIQCLSLYQSILKDDNKLNNLLPSPITHKYSLRNPRKYPLFKCRTERFRNSFIPYCVAKWDSLGS